MLRDEHQGDSTKLGSNTSQDKVENDENNSNRGKICATTSKKAPKKKKVLFCKFCDKKFTNSQALGGHQNAHREERAAAKKDKILSMASAYRNKDSLFNLHSYYSRLAPNQKLQVQPPPMIPKPYSYSWPHLRLGHDHNLWLTQPPNMFQPDRSGSGLHHHHLKSEQPAYFSTFRGRPQSSGSQQQLSLCADDKKNSGQAIEPQKYGSTKEKLDLNLKPLCDEENFSSSIRHQNYGTGEKPLTLNDEKSSQSRSSSSTRHVSGTKWELDLTLRLGLPG